MLAYKARHVLVMLAKLLPFALCAIVCVAYIENIASLSIQDYYIGKDGVTLHTPISWWIADLYEYNWYAIILCIVLAIAMSTCIWNRLAVLYLALHLLFKRYIETIELEEYQIYLLCLINILINVILIYKGLKQWLTFK